MHKNYNLTRTLLIVDDDLNTLKSVARSLKFSFKKVLTAPSAVEALELLKQNEVHIVLSDYNMGGMDGVELLKEINATYQIPVVIMTGHANIKAVIEFANNRAYKVIEKPFESLYLETVLNDLGLELNEQARQVQMSNLGELTSVIMHEINNPLGVLLLRSTLLKMGVESGSLDDAEVEKHIRSIEDLTQRVVRIITDTRNMLTGKDLKSTNSLVDPSKLKEFLESQVLAKSKCPTILSYNLQPDKFYFDQALLEQVLSILLNNSLEAVNNNANSWIKFEGENSEEGLYKIKVTDSGKGIPEHLQKTLFTKGVSGKKSTGLGLFLSKKLLEAKGAKIEYNPKCENTQFVITITKSGGTNA
jgi:signal transduction histidine kinase